jgi:2-polyprenyl-3-methyl-5-hydroxy-6-metoxy-1,4-benzoquinol methylase
MVCSCCAFGNTADQHFTAEKAAKELQQYRRKGPGPTTRGLRDGLAFAGLREGTVLDVGGGLGVLSFELLDLGMDRAVMVDASSAYLAVASDEAARRGRSASVAFVHGDFLALAGQLAPSTVVTLDRTRLFASPERSSSPRRPSQPAGHDKRARSAAPNLS